MRSIVIAFVTFAIAACAARALAIAQDTGRTESVPFEEYFAPGALRIDIVHSGTRDADEMSVHRIVKEPVWSGPTSRTVPDLNLGQYRFDVIDEGSGRVIYRYGYSTLFGEWMTTDQAKVERRSFEETLEMPCPQRPVVVTVWVRDDSGRMEEMFRTRIDPADHQIGRPPLLAPGTEVFDVLVSGPPSECVDVAILGDGYTVEDRVKFENDCAHFAENFFAVEPFKSRRGRFNMCAVFAPSMESGIDEPRKGIYRDTPFGITFNTFDIERYCMSHDVWAMHDALSNLPHDAILLMANSSRYGGGAIFNFYTVFVSDNEYDDYLPVHEFGHGFAGLGDEYYTSAVAYNEFYPAGVEPWEPNITALLDPANIKWKRFVAPGTPLPTRENDASHAGGVGAFEGAGYAAKGLFRPAKDCKMFSKGNRDFCKVCEQGLIDVIDSLAPAQAP